MLKKLLSKNKSNNKQKILIQSLEGIGDILEFETRRKRYEKVKKGLTIIHDIIKDLFDIKKDDPDKFEQIVVSREFFDLYKNDKKEAQLRLAFDPDKYLIVPYTAIHQFSRIHEAAIESGNNEISRFAVYNLSWTLAHITKFSDNDIFVKQILHKLFDASKIALRNNDSSMYASSTDWYTRVVFDRYKKEKFDLSYLDECNKHFYWSMKLIVDENQHKAFKAAVSSLVDGLHIQIYDNHKIWDYGHLLFRNDFSKYGEIDKKYNTEDIIKELAHSQEDINTKEELDNWFNKFNELKDILNPYFNQAQKVEAKKLEDKINNFIIAQYKHNRLKDEIVDICVYSIFKKKESFVKCILEFKQPPDSDASWGGLDIIPSTINEAISFYFKRSTWERSHGYFEDHHDREIYFKRYFVILLARLIQNIRPDNDDNYPQLDNYNLPDLHVYKLSSIESGIDDLVNVAKQIKNDKDLLLKLGVDINSLDELFDIKLIPFLESLKIKSEARIRQIQREQKISKNKVKEFIGKLSKEFYEVATFRNIFKNYLKIFLDQKKGFYSGKIKNKGINRVDYKSAFFNEWHIHYSDWGENYGRTLALFENTDIFEKLEKFCKSTKGGTIDLALDKIDDLSRAVIFTTHASIYKFFSNSNNFQPKWHSDCKKLNISGFEGYYNYKEEEIPVFSVAINKNVNEVLILNKSRLGNFVQHSPIEKKEDEKYRNDIFYIKIKSFSEDKNFLNKFIAEPPPWLKKINGKTEQENYLKERVLLQVFSRHELKKHKKFDGFLVVLDD